MDLRKSLANIIEGYLMLYGYGIIDNSREYKWEKLLKRRVKNKTIAVRREEERIGSQKDSILFYGIIIKSVFARCDSSEVIWQSRKNSFRYVILGV